MVLIHVINMTLLLKYDDHVTMKDHIPSIDVFSMTTYILIAIT